MPADQPAAEPTKTPWRLAGAGAALGLLAAIWSGLGSPLPAGGRTGELAATVNGAAIPRLEYERAIEAIATDKRGPLTAADRERALSNLIKEELLSQRALEIGLAETDRTVRKAIVSAMLSTIIADQAGLTPTEAELRDFYDANPDLLSTPPRLRLRAARLNTPEAAQQLALQLAGGAPFDETIEQSPDAERLTVPDDALPPKKLNDYIGRSLTDAALTLDAGTIAGPIDVGGTPYILWVLERRETPRPAFEDKRDIIEAEWRRRREAERVVDYLAQLERRADIERFIDTSSEPGE